MTPSPENPPPDPVHEGDAPRDASLPSDGSAFDTAAFAETLQLDLKSKFTFDLAPPPQPPAPSPLDLVADTLAELAADMLDLLRRVKGLETGQSDVIARIERVEVAVRDGARLQSKETDAIRRELLSEHDAVATRTVAEAIFPVLDRLRPIRAALHPRKQEAFLNQTNAVLECLGGMLRAMGITAYEPALGTAFDPVRMIKAGEKAGAVDVVLAVERPGYVTKNSILRPAGVVLAPQRRN